MVNSTGRDIRSCAHCSHVFAWSMAVAKGWLSGPPGLAHYDFPAWSIGTVVCAGFASRYLLQLRSDGSHAAAHDPDDGFAGPLLNWRFASRLGLFLTNPVTALILMGASMFIWHVPGPYELAVRSSAWHWLEHACFFFASIIFWWPVVQPWPSRAQWPRWAMVPYLVIADLENTALSAILVFSDKILYPSYAAGPSLFAFTPQEDQAAAGAIMWVVGSLAFIVPAILIAIECLSRRRAEVQVSLSTRPKEFA